MATVSDGLNLEVSLTADQRSLVESAAAAVGQPIAAFVASAVVDKARKTVESRRGIRLSDRDRDHFLALLDNPPEPGPGLLRAAQQHQDNVVQ
jgi:uncharacterized protein (DUF1778 family)